MNIERTTGDNMRKTSRQITHHHDGHGLNEANLITSDAPDASGAPHFYQFSVPSTPGGIAGFVQFQQGPRLVDGSIGGALDAALLAVLIDRLEGFQSGPFACSENDEQLTHLRAALALMKARADARAARGVLGKNEK